MHTHQWVCTLLLGPSIRQSKLTVFATIYVQQILAFFPLKVLEVLANLASCFGFFRLTRKSAFFSFQGKLTEGEGSVQLSSWFRSATFNNAKVIYFLQNRLPY